MADLIYKKVALALIDEMPTVDSVTVIRCKDCKHGIKDDIYDTWQCVKDAEYDEELCMYFGFTEWHRADFYCADGERRCET